MFDTIRAVFERFGFLPLDTPGTEREDVLTGGDPEFRKQIFRVSQDGTEERELALRFDLTVPLARVVASYPNDLPKPFKRYQMGKVWRGERQQAGRFREFVQFDADIVGSKSPMADAEIISLMYETMTALGFSKFIIRVNDRKILNGLAAYAGFSEDKNDAVLRAIDKLDKMTWEAVREELMRGTGSALSSAQADAIKKFIDIRGGSAMETLVKAGELMANSEQAQEGIRELGEIASCLAALGVPEQAWTIDLSVARGLGYYTGPVFETTLLDLPSIGSVFSGGRYDGLVNRFSSIKVPATGTSVGVDRLFAAMEKLKMVPSETTVTRAMVLNFAPDARFLVQTAVADLRRAGIPAEVYLGGEVTLKAQLSAAIKQGIPFVVIIGDDERASGKAQVKDTVQRTQTEVPFREIASYITGLVHTP